MCPQRKSSDVAWTKRPLDNASLGWRVPFDKTRWTKGPLHDGSLVHGIPDRFALTLDCIRVLQNWVFLTLLNFLSFWDGNLWDWIYVTLFHTVFCILNSWPWNKLKGTQDWEFFWLWFWILCYFIVSYAQILRFCKKHFLIRPLLGEIQLFRAVWD
jgi:hypothetical protein